MTTKKQPTLHLQYTPGPAPSLEDLLTLYTKLTGREPTAAEIEEAKAVLDAAKK